MKTTNAWKPATVKKTCSHPSISNYNQQCNFYRRIIRDIIKTPEINKGTITSPKGDRTIIENPEVVRTRSGGAIQAQRPNDFIYY